MEISSITKIEKESISSLKFHQLDVLTSEEEKQIRDLELTKGMTLGNVHKLPTQIYFEDVNADQYRTDATIWAVTEKNILLKNGVCIPISSIHKIVV